MIKTTSTIQNTNYLLIKRVIKKSRNENLIDFIHIVVI